jgi:hypothetical protein
VRRRKKSCVASSGAGVRDVAGMNDVGAVMTDKEDDLILAQTLLGGRMGKMGDTVFLKGEDELNARRALARVLLSKDPLNPVLAAMLAVLFEPDPGSEPFTKMLLSKVNNSSDDCYTLAWSERTLSFKRRSNKQSTPPLRDGVVGSWIQCRVDEGVRVKQAKALAMKKFGLSEETARRIWLRWLRWQRRLAVIRARFGQV